MVLLVQPRWLQFLRADVSSFVRIGCSITKRLAFSALLRSKFPSGPIVQRNDMITSSRMESIAGLVTWANSCLK